MLCFVYFFFLLTLEHLLNLLKPIKWLSQILKLPVLCLQGETTGMSNPLGWRFDFQNFISLCYPGSWDRPLPPPRGASFSLICGPDAQEGMRTGGHGRSAAAGLRPAPTEGVAMENADLLLGLFGCLAALPEDYTTAGQDGCTRCDRATRSPALALFAAPP